MASSEPDTSESESQSPSPPPSPASSMVADGEDGPGYRFLAYARLAKALTVKTVKANIRYSAYGSDVGEAFRPVLAPWMVNATYGVAGLYVAGEVALAGYREKERGSPDWIVARQCAKTATFELFASLLLPMTIIHQTVHVAQGVFSRVGRFQTWGPSIVGLMLIPGLPIIDEPMESLTDLVFDKVVPLPENYEADAKKED